MQILLLFNYFYGLKSFAPQPAQFDVVNMVTIKDENGIIKSVPEKPEKMRAQRWSNIKQQKGKEFVEYIDSEKHFSPYTSTPGGIAEAKLYAALRNDTIDISYKGVSTKLLTWLAIISPTLLPFITESKTDTVSYNRQRVMRQLGYDQSAIQIVGEMGCSDSMTAAIPICCQRQGIYCVQIPINLLARWCENQSKDSWRLDILENIIREPLRLHGETIGRISRNPKIPLVYHNDTFL